MLSRAGSDPLAAVPAATQRLAVLEELGVPHAVAPAAGDWAALSSGDPRRAVHWYAGAAGVPGPWRLGDLPLPGRVAPAAEVERRVDALPGTWRRGVAITGPGGGVHARVWHSSTGGTLFPFDPDEQVATMRSEAYLAGSGGGRARARDAYYALRPFLPRRLQIAARRAYSRVQAGAAFPRWPVEPALHDLVELVLGAVADSVGGPVPYVAPWPADRTWALVLTHDVETAAGRDGIERLRRVERAVGARSAWNLVPERYVVRDELVRDLAAEGCEVGVHGLRHDGRDLAPGVVERRLPAMREWAARWGATGFRAPATHRDWALMPRLGFGHDSSYFDTDPYEPMPGGCCSWLPFFNGDLVEVPITLPQDHTVFTILRRDEGLWQEKAETLRERGGMACLIVHPDYALDDRVLDAYARFLRWAVADPGVWVALPREVAAWWRRRAATSLEPHAAGWAPIGPAADEVAVAMREPRPPARTLPAAVG